MDKDVEQLLVALGSAANYIDKLGGSSTAYRQHISAITDRYSIEVQLTDIQKDERIAFEEWAAKEYPGLEIRQQNLLGTYTKAMTDWLYTGWEARAMLAAAQKPKDIRNAND